MEVYGSVQQKMRCIFTSSVVQEPSKKRSNQSFKVVATGTLQSDALQHDIATALPTEKLDGTCCLIKSYKGQPWLWARHDRKPNKPTEGRFRKHLALHRSWEVDGKKGDEPMYAWDASKDFKDVPTSWIPASGVPFNQGIPQPDDMGHIPGWVPLEQKSRVHCWHLAAVDLKRGLSAVLRESDIGFPCCLQIDMVPLGDLEGHTAELIGTHVNANPYGLGCKQCPVHLLVVHGSISVPRPPASHDFDRLQKYIEDTHVEGIVWHCQDGALFKLHCHHVSLSWPVKDPSLSGKSVYIVVNPAKYELSHDENTFIGQLALSAGKQCGQLKNLHLMLTDEESIAS